MTSREQLAATINHQSPDRLCVDFGAGFQTGMGAGAVHRLRQALLGQPEHRVKIIEPYQMLGEILFRKLAALLGAASGCLISVGQATESIPAQRQAHWQKSGQDLPRTGQHSLMKHVNLVEPPEAREVEILRIAETAIETAEDVIIV